MLSTEELIERIKDGRYDVDDLCDILHITVEDITETFKYRIEVYRDSFSDLDDWEESIEDDEDDTYY